MNPDGSIDATEPDGKLLSLMSPDLGQLVVCDTGVVAIPKNSVVTFIGRDKVVVLNPDGSSTVFNTDGRVEQRVRSPR